MPEPKILPTTFNNDNNVAALFNVVNPDTFKVDLHVVILFDVVDPETFKVEINVEGFLNLTNVGGFVIAL